MNKGRLIIAIILSFLLGVGCTFGATYAMQSMGKGSVRISTEEYQRLTYMDQKYSKAERVWKSIQSSFYKEVTDEELEDGMLKGLFAGTGDQFSAYMNKEEYASWNEQVTGEFEGVGVTYSEVIDGEGYQILKVHEDSPAEKAGLKAGDVMMKVDGKTYDTIEEFGAALRGKAGTEVTVTYIRDGKEKEVTMIRAKITIKTVEHKVLDGNIGYIKIEAFEPDTYKDFHEALSDLESKKVKGFILDLRDNGGGLVREAEMVADELLGSCDMYYTEDHDGQKEHHKSDSDKTALPYVLLVNENSASASEILACSIQDNKGGPLVGVRTYGKGLIQMQSSFDDGSGYKIAILQVFTPNGNKVHKVGLKPDYVVKGEKAQLNKAIELLKK